MPGNPLDADIARAQQLVARLRPLLHGQRPGVQGIALLDLTATWLAGHHPELRPKVLSQFIQALVELIPENEREIAASR